MHLNEGEKSRSTCGTIVETAFLLDERCVKWSWDDFLSLYSEAQNTLWLDYS